MKFPKIIAVLAAVFLLSWQNSKLWASPKNQFETERTRVEFLGPFHQTGLPAIEFLIVRFKLKTGWHIYWKNPGDSGTRPQFKFNSSAVGKFKWPIPDRIPFGPLMNFGYENEVLFSFPLDRKNLDTSSVISELKWLVCKEKCIPEKATLSLNLPRNSRSKESLLVQKALAALPKEMPKKIRHSVADGNIFFQWDLNQKSPIFQNSKITKIEFYPFDELLINNAAPQSWSIEKQASGASVDRLVVKLDVSLSDDQIENAHPSIGGLFKIVNADHQVLALETTSKSLHSIPPPSSENEDKNRSFWIFLALAFLGGLLLNVMPCVLPVLALKALFFANLAHQKRNQQIKLILSFCSGIILCFCVLGGALGLFNFFGAHLGWGFQLSSPLYLSLLFLLFSLISYNLLGIFEVNAVFGNWVGRSIDESRPGGSFLSGVFTTLLATPCTAPFMGSALGATIGRPFHESFGIFFFLGLGMAAPFLIFGTSPFLQKLMPRPGPWLNTVKKVFALPMILTAAWIFSLLWNQQNQIVLINLAILAMITLLLVFKASKRTMITTSVIISLSLAFFVPLKNSVSKRTQKIQSSAWKSYSESQLEESLSNGKAVFVDFTADWCVSCQYNKKVVLDTPEILAFFAEKQILLMRADWTDFSPKIGEELKRLKRQGVPVYALYLPGNRHKPILLPEILKKSVVREAIDRYIRK